MKNFYTVVIQWRWSQVGPWGWAVPQAQLYFVWSQPQHRLHCFRRKWGRIWYTEDEAPVKGIALSGWPAHAQECDMESHGGLNWEVLSQARIVGVDGSNWHRRALARELCVCPESTRGVGAGSGLSALPSRSQSVCVICGLCTWIVD